MAEADTRGRLLPRLLLLLLLAPSIRGVRVATAPAAGVQQQQQQQVADGSEDTQRPSWHQAPAMQATTTPPDLVEFGGQTWEELVLALSQVFNRLLQPYWAYVPDFPLLDWQESLASVMERADVTKQPIRAVAVAVATLSVPILVKVSGWVLQWLVKLVDDTVFVATGQGLGLGRHSQDGDFLRDLTDLLLQGVHLLTRHLGY